MSNGFRATDKDQVKARLKKLAEDRVRRAGEPQKSLDEINEELIEIYKIGFFRRIGIAVTEGVKGVFNKSLDTTKTLSLLVSLVRLILTIKKKEDEDMEKLLKKLKRKLKERSTWAGVLWLLGMLGIGTQMDPETLALLADNAISGISAILVFLTTIWNLVRKEKEEKEEGEEG